MKTFFITVVLAIPALARADIASDEAALRALDQAYVAEWMAGDADGVMALFTEDATLVPHHGDQPIKGHDAIRYFWFNPDYAPTIVPEWRIRMLTWNGDPRTWIQESIE
jgi:hypothetical protein